MDPKESEPKNEQHPVLICYEPEVKDEADRLFEPLKRLGFNVHSENWNHYRETDDGPLHYYADISTSTIYFGHMVEKDALAVQAVLQNLKPPIETNLKAGGIDTPRTTWGIDPHDIRVFIVASI